MKSFEEMFRSICKRLPCHTTKDSEATISFFPQKFLSLKSISNSSHLTDQQSLTVSYLTNSCGLSLDSATSASRLIKIESTKKADSVIKLFRTYGFSETQITTLISKYPPLILAHPEKNLRPKIDYFISLGISGPDLAKFACADKSILMRSLKNQITPMFDFLRSFVSTNENLIRALKQSTRIIHCNTEKVLVPNINTLRNHGVPEPNISKLIVMQPKSITLRIDLFKEVADEISEMGFDPKSQSFVLAVRSMSMVSKRKWLKKKEVLLSSGWSEKEFTSAFKLQPMLMLCSEKKIKELMDFLVNKAGLKQPEIARCPNVFLTSLEKRLIPRCSVLQLLISKNLISKDIQNLVGLLAGAKKYFEAKFVTIYKDKVPDLTKAYQGEIEFRGFL